MFCLQLDFDLIWFRLALEISVLRGWIHLFFSVIFGIFLPADIKDCNRRLSWGTHQYAGRSGPDDRAPQQSQPTTSPAHGRSHQSQTVSSVNHYTFEFRYRFTRKGSSKNDASQPASQGVGVRKGKSWRPKIDGRGLTPNVWDHSGGMVRLLNIGCWRHFWTAPNVFFYRYPFPPAATPVVADWEIYLVKTAELISEQQNAQRLLDVRTRLYELLAHCIPATLIMNVSKNIGDAV